MESWRGSATAASPRLVASRAILADRCIKYWRLIARALASAEGFHSQTSSGSARGMHDYRKLKVWRAAHQLALDSYGAARELPGFERFGLADQIRRAAVSVSANIAEGAGRGRGPFPYFLRIAAGSVCELEAEFEIAHDLGYIDADLYQALTRQTIEIKRMLWALVRKSEKDRRTQNPARAASTRYSGPPGPPLLDTAIRPGSLTPCLPAPPGVGPGSLRRRS